MPAKWGRPADLVEPPTQWRASNTVFRLDDLDAASAAGVLAQWALAEHIRVLLVLGKYRSARGFAKTHELSEDRLHNFLNGNRIARFEDWAAVLEIFGPSGWPDPDRTAKVIAAARVRADKHRAARVAAVPAAGTMTWNTGQGGGVVDWLGERTGPSGPTGASDMDPHPEAEAMEAAFTTWVLAQPEVREHLGRGQASVEVSAGRCEPGQAGVEVFVGERLVAGRIWAPEGWGARVAEAGLVDEFVLDIQGATVTAARVVVDGDDPELDDVNVEAGVAAAGSVGRLEWDTP